MFSSPSSSGCQQISNFISYAYGQLKISDSSIFMLGVHASSPYQLHFYKHTFGETSPDWSQKLSWPYATWTKFNSESLMISPSFYTFFPYGSSTFQYLYMAVISLSDGTASNRYKSSIICSNVLGSGVSGDYIAVSVACSTNDLLIFNRATNLFGAKSFSGSGLYGVGLDATGR